ncbi:MAG: hypothetical protein WD467_01380 [Candidatus Saccharimonadales bacterium]
MPKKRKTRQQKERLQARPRSSAFVDTTPVETRTTNVRPPKATDKSDEPDSHQLQRVRLMKLSLLVFAVLAIVQLIFWWSLRSGVLPDTWTELLLG